jgi:hypothetical protein
MSGNQVFLQACLNDSPPLRFILDSGVPVSALDDNRIEMLGFKRDMR